MSEPLMILVAGPYRSGTNDDPALIEANVAAMTQAALDLFRLGHLPVLGEWFALPLIEAAGSTGIGDDVFNEIFHPIAERVLEKCDACLRIGGRSEGADRMVEVARSLGKTVVHDLAAIPSPLDPEAKRAGRSGELGGEPFGVGARDLQRLFLRYRPWWSMKIHRVDE